MSDGVLKLFEILNEDLRETRSLARAAHKQADAAMEEAKAAMKRADASWELVVMTRNQLTKPWWDRLLGR